MSTKSNTVIKTLGSSMSGPIRLSVAWQVPTDSHPNLTHYLGVTSQPSRTSQSFQNTVNSLLGLLQSAINGAEAASVFDTAYWLP